MANYAFTIDSTFSPFSMQEMLTPFVAYKDAFEKSEEAYDELNKSLDFEGMRNLPEDSKARKIYEGYANDLTKQAEDLAQNGLTMDNRRSLMSLKRRYKSEMGRIIKADEAMREEKKLRQSLNAQDSSRLYATDNLNIDDFLDGNNPNLYSISGNELYARGAEAGKAASSRMTQFGDMGPLIGRLYRNIVQRNGYSQAAMQEFRRNVESIPELADTIDDIMNASGASENLTGVSRGRARQNIINGIVSGAIYQEQHNPTRDPNVLDAMQKNQLDMQQKNFNLQATQLDMQAARAGYRVNDQGKLEIDPQRMQALKDLKQSGKKGSSGSSSSTGTQSAKSIQISWHGNNPKDTNGKADDDVTTKFLSDTDELPNNPVDYDDLPTYVKNKVDKIIGNGSVDGYNYFYQPFERGAWGGIWDDTEAKVALVPKKTNVKQDTVDLDFSAH